MPDDDCDDDLAKHNDNDIEVADSKVLPKSSAVEGKGIKRRYTYNEMKTCNQNKAEEVLSSWSEKFERDRYNGSSYGKKGETWTAGLY